MYTIDDRRKGLPAQKDQVVGLYESLNSPHLAIPGRTAGTAKAYIVSLRGQQGFAVFVYLWLPESAQCAVYMPSNRAETPEQLESEEAEALGFVESMGFIMDNLGFRTRSITEQDQLMKTLPVFQRDPSLVPKSAVAVPSPQATHAGSKPAPAKVAAASQAAPSGHNNEALGKLFSSFCLLMFLLSCAHVPTEKERKEAQVHYDLAVSLAQKEPQPALLELDRALALDPDMPEAHNAKGILMHVVFGRPEEAVGEYKKAIAVRPTFSEAKVNLGNVYLDQKRYDEAIVQYREALNDMLYPTPFLAQGNLGWAQYKKGDVEAAIQNIKSSVTLNPKFCLGYRNLGTIYQEKGAVEEACKAFGKFRESCPDVADAYLREGVCLVKKGDVAAARASFASCAEKSRVDSERDECKKFMERLP